MEKSVCTFQFLKIIFQFIFNPNISNALEKLEDNLEKLEIIQKLQLKSYIETKYKVERKLNKRLYISRNPTSGF